MNKRNFSERDKENAYFSLGLDLVAKGKVFLGKIENLAHTSMKIKMVKTLYDKHGNKKIH